MAFDHPTFMLQFDHDSSQEDHSAHESISREISTKTAGQNRYNAGYNSLKSDKTISLNSGCSNKLNYSLTNSQTNDDLPLGADRDDQQACGVDEIMGNMSDIHDSEISKYANYSEMLRELGQESKMVLLQYSQVFGDSESYEQQASQAITDLTAHAELLLQNLNDQKKILCSRINSISEALKHEC